MTILIWYLCIGAAYVIGMIVFVAIKGIAEDEINNLRSLPPFVLFASIMISAIAWPYYVYRCNRSRIRKILNIKRDDR